MAGYAELTHDEYVERHGQTARHLETYRHAAARQRQDNRVRPQARRAFDHILGEPAARVAPITENHRSPPLTRIEPAAAKARPVTSWSGSRAAVSAFAPP